MSKHSPTQFDQSFVTFSEYPWIVDLTSSAAIFHVNSSTLKHLTPLRHLGIIALSTITICMFQGTVEQFMEWYKLTESSTVLKLVCTIKMPVFHLNITEMILSLLHIPKSLSKKKWCSTAQNGNAK